MAAMLQGTGVLISMDPAGVGTDQIVITTITPGRMYGAGFDYIIWDDLQPTLCDVKTFDRIGDLVVGGRGPVDYIKDFTVRAELEDIEPLKGFYPGKRQFQESPREILAAQRRGSKRKGRR